MPASLQPFAPSRGPPISRTDKRKGIPITPYRPSRRRVRRHCLSLQTRPRLQAQGHPRRPLGKVSSLFARTELTCSRVWFFNTVTGLYGLWLKSGTRRSDSEKRADVIQRQKYLCDLTFVCEYSRARPPCLPLRASLTRSLRHLQPYMDEGASTVHRRPHRGPHLVSPLSLSIDVDGMFIKARSHGDRAPRLLVAGR